MKSNQNEQNINKEKIISFLSENKPLLKKKYNIETVALYGSYARDEAHENSDIDIVVQMTKTDFMKLCSFKEFLENKFHKTISVTTFNGLRTYIRRKIDEDLIYV